MRCYRSKCKVTSLSTFLSSSLKCVFAERLTICEDASQALGVGHPASKEGLPFI